jgi:transposase
MGEQKRRRFTGAQKIKVLREHFLEKKEVSTVCEKNGIAPSLFYYWQKQLFENGEAAFEHSDASDQRDLEKKVGALEERLARKDSVIAEVTEEMVKLKKELGEP